MAFLAAETLGLGHGDALQSDFLQGFLHFVELEGLNDRLNFLHSLNLSPKTIQRDNPKPAQSPQYDRAVSRASIRSDLQVPCQAAKGVKSIEQQRLATSRISIDQDCLMFDALQMGILIKK
jgi:hypothetical protein